MFSQLNDEELPEMASWLGLDTAGVDDGDLALATFGALDCEMLCVTRGGDGAVLITKKGGWTEHPGFEVRVYFYLTRLFIFYAYGQCV